MEAKERADKLRSLLSEVHQLVTLLQRDGYSVGLAGVGPLDNSLASPVYVVKTREERL